MRLYYTDAYLREFDATIISTKQTDRGLAINLDNTAFYPTSGGQPHDVGIIGGLNVLDVWDDDEGIWHLVENQPESNYVSCAIDWTRRFDHMQQHTGQHILSSIFSNELNAATVGFHIGPQASTLDIDMSDLNDEIVRMVETGANQIVWKNILIKIQTITEDEIHKLAFRKQPKVSGQIRVVEIDQVDVSACGGTHVTRTGEIGLIKIIKTERYKGGFRCTFLCGKRALNHYQISAEIIHRASAGLSIHPSDLPDTIERLQSENTHLRHANKNYQKEYLKIEAERLWQDTAYQGKIKKIAAHWNDRPFGEIQSLANDLRNYPATLIFLATTVEGKARFLCTKSSDLTEIDAEEILKSVCQIIGGRGGGSPEMAQGGAPNADHQTIINSIRKIYAAMEN